MNPINEYNPHQKQFEELLKNVVDRFKIDPNDESIINLKDFVLEHLIPRDKGFELFTNFKRKEDFEKVQVEYPVPSSFPKVESQVTVSTLFSNPYVFEPQLVKPNNYGLPSQKGSTLTRFGDFQPQVKTMMLPNPEFEQTKNLGLFDH